MERKQEQLIANIIRDAGLVLSEMETTRIRYAALRNLKKNAALLEDEI